MNIDGEVLKYQNYLSINDVPSNVVKLCFTNLKLRVLPDLRRFTQLRVLYCSHNRLTTIDNLPDFFDTIEIRNYGISKIIFDRLFVQTPT